LFDLMAPRAENDPMNATANISIRPANPSDYSALWQLAALDDRALPSGPFLVAELDREVVAAISVPAGTTIADPFRRTAEATALLELRASQLSRIAA
jgi:hypothetical protein